MYRFSRLVLAFAALALGALSCAAPLPAQTAEPRVVTVVVEVTATPAPGVTKPSIPVTDAQPSPTSPPAQPTKPPAPTGTDAPPAAQCTALQNVNFRKGPGQAFDPPFNVIRKGDVVIPDGFQADGFPSGSWIHVSNPQTGEKGWISADTTLVECTIEVSGLPGQDIPPTPAVVRLKNSKVEGDPNGIDGKVEFSSRFLMRFIAIGPDGKKDGDHIQNVQFLVRDEGGGTEFFKKTEGAVPFCIFGGDNGCASWPKRDGRYVWGPNGDFVEDGATYRIDITANTDEATGYQQGNWNFTITVDVP